MSTHEQRLTLVTAAALNAVDSLSPQARTRLTHGADYVRLPRHEANRLIAAVDALRDEAT